MTQTSPESIKTVETKYADALARLLTYLGDTDNLTHWVTEFEDSFPSPIIHADSYPNAYPDEFNSARGLAVAFEDGSVLHLTVTQVKEANR